MMEIREGDFGSFIAMVVRDAERMLQFYQNALGMKLAFTDDNDEGVTKYYLSFKGGMLKLFAPDEAPELSKGDFMGSTGYGLQAYMVTNMADLFQSLEDNSIRIITPPQPTGDGSKWGIVADPEGNLIEFSGTG